MAFNDGVAVLCLRKKEIGDLAIRELAGALAGTGLGSLVRVDYAENEVFAYTRFPSVRLTNRFRKSNARAYTPFYTTILGRRVAIRCAEGWRFGLNDVAPALLTADVVTFDVDCPDAGEGDWEHWKAKVLAIEVTAGGNPFADPYADDITTLLRCRRWAFRDGLESKNGNRLEQHRFNEPFQQGWSELLDYWHLQLPSTHPDSDALSLSCSEMRGDREPSPIALQAIIAAEKQLMRCAPETTSHDTIIGPNADYVTFSYTGSRDPQLLDLEQLERVEWAMAKLAWRLKPYGGSLIVYRS
jgi:hypothetical protein